MKEIKLMWADTDSVLWDIKTDKPIPNEEIHELSQNLKERIELWVEEYGRIYKDWLNNDNEHGLFDINSQINNAGVHLCHEINRESKRFKCYYWFDIDRSRNPNFVWQRCPKCRSKLTIAEYGHINRGVCEKCDILLP